MPSTSLTYELVLIGSPHVVRKTTNLLNRTYSQAVQDLQAGTYADAEFQTEYTRRRGTGLMCRVIEQPNA